MARYLMMLACVVLLAACPGSGGGGGGGASGGGAGASGGGGGLNGERTCPPLAPCGGSIDGTWRVSDICIANAAEAVGMAVDDPECRDLIVGAETSASGSMTFQGGSATSSTVLTMDVRGVWTLPCLRAISGVSDIDLASTCTNIGQNYADNPVFSASSCKVVGLTCDCMVTAEQQFSLGDAYTIKGSEIMFEGDPSKTTFCVSGSTLHMSSTSMGESTVSGTLTLTR